MIVCAIIMVAIAKLARRPPCSSDKSVPGTTFISKSSRIAGKKAVVNSASSTVGRLDQLREGGQLDGLLQSGAKFAESVMVLAAHRQGKTPAIHTRRFGPAMV